MKKTICIILAICFTAIIAYSGRRAWLINENYKQEATIHAAVLKYKPATALAQTQGMPPSGTPNPDQPEEIINPSIVELRAAHPGAIGWLTVPNTRIDYPFAQAQDNKYYLNRDVSGNFASTGTLFIDARCTDDFTSTHTIIYGHHTKNGSMFGSLKSFSDKPFFDENQYGYIYLPYANLTLEVFAYLVVNKNDQEIYNPDLSDVYFDYVKQKARHYRELGLTDTDRIVTLSSCSYEFSNARMVLLARIKPAQ